jgi:hypothetical protein
VLGSPVFIRSEESMTHFMTHQHIIDDPRSTIPVRQGKHTAIYIKRCCRDLTVLYDEVLGSE